MKKISLSILILFVTLGLFFLFGPKVSFDPAVPQVDIPKELDDYLSSSEKLKGDIKEGCEKTIIWYNDSTREKTKYSIVYLHGFSATRKEIEPTCDSVARRIGANLYYNRLSGHGRPGEALGKAKIEDWLKDAVESIRIGEQIGDSIILISNSTGGTLAAWLEINQVSTKIAKTVYLSPNYGLYDSKAFLLTLPWGSKFAELVLGKTYNWEPKNELQGKYWSTSYPSAILSDMGVMVDYVAGLNFEDITTPTLYIYSQNDKVVSAEKTNAIYKRLNCPKQKIEVINGGHNSHVNAGFVLAPHNTMNIVTAIVDFIK